MRFISALIFLLLLFLNSAFSNSDNFIQPLVSSEWLEKHLNDLKLVVLHIGPKDDYKEKHIPGARLISMKDLIVENAGIHHEMPTEEEIKKILDAVGLNNNSYAVICYADDKAVTIAARLFVLLEYAGMKGKAAVLDGGLAKWNDEGRTLSNDVKDFKLGNFEVKIDNSIMTNKKWIFQNLENPNVKIIDARPPDQYSGKAADSNTPRQGHLPNSVNIPFYTLNDEDDIVLFKKREDLKKIFEYSFIVDTDTLAVYCGSGVWSSPVYLVARYLGYNVLFYDGSINEWGNDYNMPMITPVSNR